MRVFLNSNRKPMVVAVKIKTRGDQNMAIELKDAYKPNTFYTMRSGWVGSKHSNERLFYIPLPQSPERGLLKIYNKKHGDKPKGIDKTFDVVYLKTMPLENQLQCKLILNPVVQKFVAFAQKFSERAGILSAGHSVYMSNDGMFRIDYLDQIVNRKTKQPMATPARISKDRGVIEISKKHFLKYSVPMRMAILLHEFSHYYLNENIDDETEADLNALMIYLGMGYPRIDGHNAFLKVFKGTPTPQNKKRHQIITKFIDNFENIKWKPC